MDHNPRNVISGVITFLTEGTTVFVQQLVDEFVDLFAIKVGRVLRLLEEEGRWVLQFFHLNQKYISTSTIAISCTRMITHLRLSKIMIGVISAHPVLSLAQKFDYYSPTK